MPRPRRVDSSQTLLSFSGPASKRPKANAAAAAAAATAPTPPNTNLVVVLPGRPPSYRPGTASAPPSQPISIVPPRRDAAGYDSGAYIVDKVVTPLDGSWGTVPATADDYDTDEEDARYAANPQRQTVQRMLCYVVGWPDEPYARQLVRCTEILDYVSPRVVEDWEYAQMEEKRAQAAAAMQLALQNTEVGPMIKKGPGRPAKTAATTAAQAAAKAAAREAAAATTTTQVGATPTISTTPTKSRLHSLVDRRRPRSGASLSGRPSLAGLQIQLDVSSMAATSQMAVSLNAPPPPPSLAALPMVLSSPMSEKQHAGPSLKRPFQKFVGDQEGVDPVTTATTTTTTNTSTNKEEDEEEEEEEEVADSDEDEDDEVDEEADEEDKEDELYRASLHTMLSAAPHPSLRKTPPGHQRQSRPAHASPLQQPSLPPPPSQLPTLQKAKTADRAADRPATYIAPPAVPACKPPPKPENKWQNYVPPSMPPLQQDTSSTKRKRPPTETPILPPALPLSQAIVHAPAPLKKAEKEAEKEAEKDDGEDEEEGELYEVDRLVGDCLAAVDEDGNGDMEGLSVHAAPEMVAAPGSRLVRFFLVRWKGDWPPDQNPTWEPAENLPPRMVRQYLKKAAQKRVGGYGR
ncbi:hypothetical protein SCUCBS95973_007890 [Sporothrix curviconia]|uniref:Chromo domain-containing protein n=1 Tax=Sporothrix curviconia TaxID=1260050 RepID=A0ABP0CIF0_9PEZI